MGVNDEIAEKITTNSVRIAQFTKGESRAILGNLEVLGRDLDRQIKAVDFGANTTTRQASRLRSLSADVNESVRDAYFGSGGNAEVLQGTLNEVGPLTQTGAVRAINTSVEAAITRVGLNPTELRVMTRDPVVLGKRTLEHWQKQSQNLQGRFMQQMRLGIAQGENNDQLVDRVIGKTTKETRVVEINGVKTKVPVRAGGIMNISEREAEALVRSSAQTVSNTTLEETYKANGDIIRGVAVLVTLDGSTTKICMSVSGGKWNTRTGDPLPDSENQGPYPGAPPYHWSALPWSALVETPDGPKRIDLVQPGDWVLTGAGHYRPCYAVHRKHYAGVVLDLKFESGTLTITGDHPVAVMGRDQPWVPAGGLRVGDVCYGLRYGPELGSPTRPPPGENPCAVALSAEELASDEVECLPLFRELASTGTTVDPDAVTRLVGAVVDAPDLSFGPQAIQAVYSHAYQGLVYNLSVAGDETYVANGILVHNCRTIIAPITRSWDELAGRTKGRINRASEVPNKTRASMDGQVPGRLTYDGLLRKKEKAGPEFANDVLGKGRADLWRRGKIELNQLTDDNLRVLTLPELRKLIG